MPSLSAFTVLVRNVLSSPCFPELNFFKRIWKLL